MIEENEIIRAWQLTRGKLCYCPKCMKKKHTHIEHIGCGLWSRNCSLCGSYCELERD